jgi:uncharacterized protein (TIGR03437 family)
MHENAAWLHVSRLWLNGSKYPLHGPKSGSRGSDNTPRGSNYSSHGSNYTTPRFVIIAAFLLLASGVLCGQNSQFKITTTSLPNATLGVPYSAPLQSSGGSGQVTWSVCTDCNPMGNLPAGLSLDQYTGIISGTPTALGKSSFDVQAFNYPNSASAILSITVAPCTPKVTPGQLPTGEVKVLYPQTQFIASGCPGPFTYAAVPVNLFSTTSLPPGLNVSSSGYLSGTPTSAGTFGFLLQLTGPNQQQTQLPYSITVNPLPTVTTQSPLPPGLVGVAYSEMIAATGGAPPYVFHISGNPPWLTLTSDGILSGTPPQAGTLNLNIGVSDSLGAETVSPFQVTFTAAVSQLMVGPATLTFNADLNGPVPPPQAISIVPATAATLPATFNVTVDNGQNGGAAPAWIAVNPASGTAPASLVVSVNQNNLAAGNYPARIQVLDMNGLATSVAVMLNVASANQQLTVAPAILNVTARSAAPGTMVENLVLSSLGAGVLSFTTSVVNSSAWITGVTSSSSTTTQNQPVFVQVQLNTNGLPVGAYHDAIKISSSAGSIQIPVSVFVASTGPAMALDTAGVLFQAVAGGGSTATSTVEILNIGDPNSTVNWEATLVTGSNWLNLVSSSGTATGATPGALVLGLAANATQLTPGPYYAIVKIADTNSMNSPQYVTAVLNLEPSSAAPSPDLAPAGLFFTTPDGSAPAAQQVQVNTSSASAVNFNVAATTLDNGTWLNATPSSGTASGQNAGSISVSVDPTFLNPGIYSGDVTVSIGSLVESVNVTFAVQPGASSGLMSRRPSRTLISRSSVSPSQMSSSKPQVAGCSPTLLAITETGLANNFAVPASWPATLIVQLNDNCAAPVTSGSVIASFSNGDAPLNLIGDSLGNYSATWQPGKVNANLVVTLNATAGNLQPAQAKLYGGIAPNQTPPPTLYLNGTVNNLNPVGGAALAPGTIAQVYGTGLATSLVTTGAAPLPSLFDNTYALVGSTAAPLYALSSGQIDIEIPNEATATQQLPLVLSVNNALTLPQMLDIVPAAPGVLSYNDGPTPPYVQNGAHLVAQHSADFSLVSSSSPAKPGEYLVMYLVGLGATNPSVASGAATPPSPYHPVTLQPTVTVGGQSANVAFAGLSPYFVGLYQINLQVPASATAGELTVDVTQNGVAANPTLLPVAQ